MAKTIKFILIATVMVSALGFGAAALAQENTAEDIPAQALDSTTPSFLPDNPFYFLKEWGRGLQSFFAFGQLKKTELEQKFANERLLELKKMVEEGKASSEILERATEKYGKTMARIKERADKIKETAESNPEVNKFLEKFTKQQVLHQEILGKLETQVPEQALEKIKEAREAHLERFKEVMTKLETRKDEIVNKVENAIDDDTEILDKIKTGMPQEIEDKLTELKAKITQRIQGCKELWWFDENNRDCGQKKFCGAYMYLGLQTFELKDDCLRALSGE